MEVTEDCGKAQTSRGMTVDYASSCRLQSRFYQRARRNEIGANRKYSLQSCLVLIQDWLFDDVRHAGKYWTKVRKQDLTFPKFEFKGVYSFG
jgi:hypothetical protein